MRKAHVPQQVMPPLVRSPHEWLLLAVTAEYVLVDWAAVWGAVRVREELASQLSTVAVVGRSACSCTRNWSRSLETSRR